MNKFEAVDKFTNELLDEFLRLCNYNDYGKINLLTISEAVDRIYGKCINEMLDEMDNAPTADVAEVVRCKDCRWYEKNPWGDEMLCQCWADWLPTDQDDFCSSGERKEVE